MTQRYKAGVVLLIVLLIAALAQWVVGPTAAQPPDELPLTIELRHEALNGDPVTGNPISIAGQDLSTVRIMLTGGTCPVVERSVPVDVVLVIDVSGSMAGDKLDATKDAARLFLTRFTLNEALPESDQVAVVSFSGSARTEIGLSRDAAALDAAIAALGSGGGTDIAAGLREAADILGSPAHNVENNAAPVIILLSDGGSDRAAAESQADRARREVGARIVTIGLGSAQEVDQDTLRALADSPEDVFFTADVSQLSAIYDQIASQIQPRMTATNIVVSYRYNRSSYELQPGSVRPPATIEGDTLTWTYNELLADNTAEFSFDVKSTSPGSASVGDMEVAYIACEEENTSVELASGPTINTLLPTPTPLPTATFTPTITPSPTVTPTATLVSPQRMGASDSTPTTEGVTGDYCDNSGFWGVWPRLLLFVALVLALLVILWAVRRVFFSGTGIQWRDALCVLPPLLLALWLIGLLYFLLAPLQGQFCEQPESVYFWRIEGDTSGIYLSHEDLPDDALPAQVSSLNETGCVGCHTVSRNGERVAAVQAPVPGPIVVTGFDQELVDLPANIRAVYIALSPDGRRIAYSDANADIQILDIAAGTSTPLLGASTAEYGEIMPAWSDDGYIAFVRAPLPLTTSISTNEQASIAVVPETGSATPVTDTIGQVQLAGLNYDPAFSPDGKWIAFAHSDSGSTYRNPNADIYLYNRTTQEIRRIEDSLANVSDTHPDWNSDSDKLAFQSTRSDSIYDVVVVDVQPDGSTRNARLLAGASTPGVIEHLPVWGEPVEPDTLFDEWAALFPWYLLPLLLIGLLFIICRLWPVPAVPEPPREVDMVHTRTIEPAKPNYFTGWRGIPVLWKPQPTLVIGLGHSGLHILTHLKKNLLDAGLGKLPEDVPLLCIVSGSQVHNLRQIYRFAGVALDPDELLPWRDRLDDIVSGAQYNDDHALREWVVPTLLPVLDPQTGLEEQRVLARLALINNLRGQTAQSGSSLWDRLKSAARNAINDDNRLNVIIVAALDDAEGSGTFIDVAFLVRQLRAALGDEGVRIENTRITAHFVAENIVGSANVSAHRQANVTAALRELKRFQLRQGTRMTYRASESDPDPITGRPSDPMLDVPLFDEIFLYDGDGDRKLHDLPAETALYPAIADSLTLWLDTAAREADLIAWRNRLLGASNREQAQSSDVIVGTGGIFQYRLPFADLLDDITLKFARQVLHMLLMGDNATGPKLDATLVTEHFFSAQESPATLARSFLRGEFGGFEPVDSGLRRALTALTFESDEALEESAREVRSAKEERVLPLCAALDYALITILNGRTTHDNNPVAQRGAKLALALAFLEALQAADGWLPKSRKRLVSLVGAGHPMVDVLQQLGSYVDQVHEGLQSIAVALGAENQPDSVYRHLAVRTTEQESIWDDLRQIKTRQYILQDEKKRPLTEVWYETYLVAEKIPMALAQLYWHVAQGKVELRLRLGDNDDRAFDPDDPHQFEQALLDLGRYFAQEVRNEESLATVLGNNELHRDFVDRTSTHLKERSATNLGIGEGQATTLAASYILSVNENIDSGLLEEEFANAKVTPLRMNTSDPFTLSLMKIADTIPETSVTSLQRARAQYNADQHLQQQEHHVLTAVMEPEAIALDYERGIDRLRDFFTRPRRLLNPAIVATLFYRAKVEVYLLAAAAASQLASEGAGPGEWQLANNRLTFEAPEMEEPLTVLTADELRAAQTGEGVLFAGLKRFIDLMDLATAQRIYERYRDDDVLLTIWERWLDADGTAWRDTRPPYVTAPAVLDDLIVITQLLILQLLGE